MLVVTSSGSPSVTIRSAHLPLSIEPVVAATPQISAALMVTAFSASSYGSPKVTALAALNGRLRDHSLRPVDHHRVGGGRDILADGFD